MARPKTEQLDQLREAVLGTKRGREVEVEPTGEIRLPEGAKEAGKEELTEDRPIKASKMSPHTFGG